jgi:hypothetical protein
MPEPTQVQRARVDTEVRAIADDASHGLSRPWVESIRRASVARLPDIDDRLDAALAATDLGAARIPVWAGLVRALQWLLILTAVGGGVWLATLAVMGYLRVDQPEPPDLAGLPLPTLMLLGGVACGLLLAFLSRFLVAATARRRARAADKRLRSAIAEVAEELVVTPIEAELTAYAEVRSGLQAARR